MRVDPEHQRNPAVKSIKSGKGHRLGNPCPYEEQIAKCSSCKNHFFMPEIKDGVCIKCSCDGHEILNGIASGEIKADAPLPSEEPKPIS